MREKQTIDIAPLDAPASKLTGLQPNAIAQMDDDDLRELHRRLHAVYKDADDELRQRLVRTHQHFRRELLQRGMSHPDLDKLDDTRPEDDDDEDDDTLGKKSVREAVGAADHSDSLCLLFRLPLELACQLACEGGEPANMLHITAVYFGKLDEWSTRERDKILRIAQDYAAGSSPMRGMINGIGRFQSSAGSDGRDVLFRTVDIPDLPAWREGLLARLRAADVEPAMEHGYIPHVTIRYLEPGEDVSLPAMQSHPVRLDTLVCSVGQEDHVYPLGSTSLLKNPDSVETLKETLSSVGLLIREADDGGHIIYGVLLVPDEPDLEGDVFGAELIRRACERYSQTLEADERHKIDNPGLEVVESFIAPDGYILDGHPVKAGSWVVGIRTDDQHVIDKVRNGTYTGLSIDGKALVRETEDTHEPHQQTEVGHRRSPGQ